MGNWRKVGAFLGLVPDDKPYPESDEYAEYADYPDEVDYHQHPVDAGSYPDSYGYDDSYQHNYSAPHVDYDYHAGETSSSPSYVAPTVAAVAGAGVAAGVAAGAGAFAASRFQTHGALAVQPEPRPEPLTDSAISSKPVKVTLTGFAQAREVGERYRDGQTVILDMTEMDDANARRLVDFAAGLAFARHGSIDKVATRVFMVHQPETGL